MKLLRQKRAGQCPPVTKKEFEDALGAMRAAEARLNYAEGDFVEAAVLELTAAEKRLNGLFRMARAGTAS